MNFKKYMVVTRVYEGKKETPRLKMMHDTDDLADAMHWIATRPSHWIVKNITIKTTHEEVNEPPKEYIIEKGA